MFLELGKISLRGALVERGIGEEGEVRGKVFERAHGAGHACGGGDETSRAKIR